MIWALTTTFGVLLFALLLKPGGTRIDLPGELSVLVMDRRRGSGHDGSAQRVNGAIAMDGVGAEMIGPTGSFGSSALTGGRFIGVGRPPLRFSAPPASTAERRTVAYRYVRVSAGPDDLRFPELGRLDRRDEVEVIGSEAGYLEVRTPDGIVGWVPRVVLVGSPIRSNA